MKKILSVIIAITIILCSNMPLLVQAETKNNVQITIGRYSSLKESSDEITVEIYSISGGEFSGHLKVKDSDGAVDFDNDVSGTSTYYKDHYVCYCEFKTTWVFGIKYNSNATITVYPYSGKSYIAFGGEGWIATMGEHELSGTKDEYYEPKFSFSKSDMQMCMALSNAMYCDNTEVSIRSIIYSTLKKSFFQVDLNETKVYGYTNSNNKEDSNKDNAPFAIMNRKNEDSSLDIIVSVRGTYKDEWIGNTELTGTEYSSEIMRHSNFENGKKSIMKSIQDYYNTYKNDYEKINLIITGHSRGAAIANLYAKDATDVMNGELISDNIPIFDNVIAYTFACPNVERVTDKNTADKMSGYLNIYNFWFTSDIVPTVPLTSPTNGWNYWKYGRCYTMDIPYKEWSKSFIKGNFYVIASGNINNHTKKELEIAFSHWKSVDDYYNKKLYTNILDYSTLYKTLHTTTTAMSAKKSRKILSVFGFSDLLSIPELKPLVFTAIINAGSIAESHDYKTYNKIINESTYIDYISYFKLYTYENAINQNIKTMVLENRNLTSSNDLIQDEINILKEFASSGDNNEKLSWDLNNPQSWDGIEWNEEGHVKSIDFTYKWLTGELDCSVFTELENLNLYANYLTGITLNNPKLVSLNCSYNDFSQSGIDLSTCTNLKELYCDGCSLSTLNLANNPELQTLSCSFNKLFALNIENNDKLSHISCPYNYLDVHEGGNLYNRFTELQSSKNAYVNYNSQMLTENAVIDTNELQALESFAKHNQNNEELNWLNDNGDIDINKVQNNVYFEFDGEKYKITAIDISNIDVQGDLDLSSFTELTTLYCDNTKITGLNVSNSTKLEDLVCENSEITSLILPVNSTQNSSKLSNIKCQNNHIDINIFTDEIIKNIESKDDYILEYKHQIIEKDISAFDESDYNLLVNFANQRNNNKILDWNLSTPGKWENVSWKFDNTSGKYKLLECHFDFMEVKGNIDVSGCDMLDEVSFSGSKINTVTISGKNLNDSTFYGCSELEAVIIKGGSTIYEGTFKMCPTLQAIYIPSNITEIADNAFENSSNITIAGVADSYAQTYANEHNINFKPGAFICGNIVAKENLDDSYQYYYPVEDVSIVYKDEVQSTSDKLGYFVLFSTESGENQYKLEYPYGYNINQTTSINNNEPLIIENPIGLICYDWRNDGCINAKDYVELLDQIKKGSEITGIDDKYFDINKDGKVTEDDWKFACNFLLYLNPNK